MEAQNLSKRNTAIVLTLAIIALAITGTTSGNEITFVLGTDENRVSLLNAPGNVAVDINIYNATQAMSIDFANEGVAFLASLGNETVAHINSTMNESSSIIAYNISAFIETGNVADVNITKYWVYGGDENIGNLITYLDNKFYGNTTAVDPPKESEIIFLVTGHGIPLNIIKEVSKEVEGVINVSAYSCSSHYSSKNLLPDTIDLCTYDVVVVCGWTYDIPDLPTYKAGFCK